MTYRQIAPFMYTILVITIQSSRSMWIVSTDSEKKKIKNPPTKKKKEDDCTTNYQLTSY